MEGHAVLDGYEVISVSAVTSRHPRGPSKGLFAEPSAGTQARPATHRFLSRERDDAMGKRIIGCNAESEALVRKYTEDVECLCGCVIECFEKTPQNLLSEVLRRLILEKAKEVETQRVRLALRLCADFAEAENLQLNSKLTMVKSDIHCKGGYLERIASLTAERDGLKGEVDNLRAGSANPAPHHAFFRLCEYIGNDPKHSSKIRDYEEAAIKEIDRLRSLQSTNTDLAWQVSQQDARIKTLCDHVDVLKSDLVAAEQAVREREETIKRIGYKTKDGVWLPTIGALVFLIGDDGRVRGLPIVTLSRETIAEGFSSRALAESFAAQSGEGKTGDAAPVTPATPVATFFRELRPHKTFSQSGILRVVRMDHRDPCIAHWHARVQEKSAEVVTAEMVLTAKAVRNQQDAKDVVF